MVVELVVEVVLDRLRVGEVWVIVRFGGSFFCCNNKTILLVCPYRLVSGMRWPMELCEKEQQ